MKKLNKRRVKMLAGIIVGVLLIVGTCIGSIINSVDYEKAENDIAIIEKARIESRELYEVSLNMGKTIWLDCSYDENKFYYEVDEAKKCYKELQKVDLEEIEKYCEHTNRDYNEILNKYNQRYEFACLDFISLWNYFVANSRSFTKNPCYSINICIY